MRLISLCGLLVLSACATPREVCLADANRELRTFERLIAQTRGNLSRGFAIEERQKIKEVPDTCQSELPDGTEISVRCTKVAVRDVKTPVAIDLNAERAKLASLEERQRQLQINANAARQQCIAAHPA